MRFSYQLSNVLSSVYHKGNLEFTPDGLSLFSPIGNKVVAYDLKNNRSQALALEADYNICNIAISPSGRLILAASEMSQVYMHSTISGTTLHRKDFKKLGKISSLSFSPNGSHYVICGGNRALVYITPGIAFSGHERELSPFKIHRVIKSMADDVTCHDWSADSKLLAIASRDCILKIACIDKNIHNVPKIINISGHSDTIVKCFFLKNSLDVMVVCRNGHVYHWEASIEPDEYEYEDKRASDADNESDKEGGQSPDTKTFLSYRKLSRQYLLNHIKSSRDTGLYLTAADYHLSNNLLVTGFSNGAFLLQEVPDLSVIYSLELSSNCSIDSIRINASGDWIALASGIHGATKRDTKSEGSGQCQLVVWEWRSESFILKQSGTGAGVTNLVECVSYSPDGAFIATGSTDGRIKLWNASSGFCFVTFSTEHKGPISALEFVPNKGGKVLVSASLDGTVRCFDMNRYRNFKSFSGPSEAKPAQFTCLAIDGISGDFIAAGAQNVFDVMMWSQQTGRLVECLSGHEAPVSGVKFSPAGDDLISCSWDGTVRIWTLFQGTKATREIIRIGQDALSLALNPAGSEIAVSTINGNIFLFDSSSGEQLGVPINGAPDLSTSQSERQPVKDKSKYFTTLSYSSDGRTLLAGGNSRYICLYHVEEKILVKKLSVTWNLSMDGMFEYIAQRKKAEFGFHLGQLRLRSDQATEREVALPGVRKGDHSQRSVNPIIMVMSVSFSPTMRSFIASTTEGVLIYSLDSSNAFDPFQLDASVTEASVRKLIQSNCNLDALMQALKLNVSSLVHEVMQSTPVSEVPFVCASLPVSYAEKCLSELASGLESSRHVEFYLDWCVSLLKAHAVHLKSHHSSSGSLMAVLRLLGRSVTRHLEDIGKVADASRGVLSLVLSYSDTRQIESDALE